MYDEFTKLRKSFMKAQQEQTQALISQKESISAILENIALLFSKAVGVPALQQHLQECAFVSHKDKKAKLLSWIVTDAYKLLGIIRPDLQQLSFQEISQALIQCGDEGFHFLHTRVEFNRCMLKPDQTYKQWVAEFRSIARMCPRQCSKEDCGCSQVDENFRDAIILRTPHRNIQSALLQQLNPSLEPVLSIAE
ncbi:hypothetical protein RF11_05591 [Thelohanellus kitauei]|uniref:Uncharacterized protein n=1 Tax=Thelohanellus kitauei TaxID=669202 RepID=A0A0C2IUJ5_THEKT|nr:hypothetical protein RF11_05591 [Thelohanellus kitauei]